MNRKGVDSIETTIWTWKILFSMTNSSQQNASEPPVMKVAGQAKGRILRDAINLVLAPARGDDIKAHGLRHTCHGQKACSFFHYLNV